MLAKQLLLSFTFLCLLICGQVSGSDTPHLDTVAHVDLHRYMGTWYEIARLRDPWKWACAHNTLSIYTLKADGSIHIVTQCQTGNSPHEVERAEGSAVVMDQASNAKLKLIFPPFQRFNWVFSGEYWIIQLADDYSYAVVSEPTQTHVVILSRTPFLSEDVYQNILDKLVLQMPNLNILNLLKTQQDPLDSR
ncbi:lipocalin family protein [Candidatus Protochlamydia phocaeensis]|uniref:lipocalin family protein n=1 Tax=Candidatus Protochlamydia phocaeensis TaxID=1414722 RepID=UPI0008388C2F|nr:lipocalin family protein [Candidatus Protochlamydia phocaeensis]